ncbi:MAG: anhydro-N-acetylmuramic acid kinase [Rickettsiales bacterium]
MSISKIYKVIGLMSGTSCDGVDAAYIETDGLSYYKPGKALTLPYPKEFRERLKEIALAKGDGLLSIENELTDYHIEAVKMLGMPADLIGFHGHTIYHNPAAGITKQIGDAKKLATSTGIDVVANFRCNDVAHGGQGAPIVPVFLQAVAATLPMPALFLNIGGVSNICYVGSELIAFDCGPGNALIDDYVAKYFMKDFDENGAIAANGNVIESVVNEFISHPYFAKRPPKSLDRNEFGVAALPDKSPDSVATLTELTAKAIAESLKHLPSMPREMYVYGGGANNAFLLSRIGKLSGITVRKLEAIDPNFLEAYAFGYLAVRSVSGLPITFPSTTGVRQPLCGGVLVKA